MSKKLNNPEKNMYLLYSHSVKIIGYEPFQNAAKFKHVWTMITYLNYFHKEIETDQIRETNATI
jgi:hypothetical protein